MSLSNALLHTVVESHVRSLALLTYNEQFDHHVVLKVSHGHLGRWPMFDTCPQAIMANSFGCCLHPRSFWYCPSCDWSATATDVCFCCHGVGNWPTLQQGSWACRKLTNQTAADDSKNHGYWSALCTPVNIPKMTKIFLVAMFTSYPLLGCLAMTHSPIGIGNTAARHARPHSRWNQFQWSAQQ